MKICLFGDAQSVHLRRLVAELSARDLDVHVVTHKPADLPGATVERFRVPDPQWQNLRRWQGRRHKYLRDFLDHFDVVNVHFIVDWGFDFETLDRGCLVASAWGSDLVTPPGEIPPSDAERAARGELLRNAKAVTACGPTFAEIVARFAGLRRSDVQVVPFGVDLTHFRFQRNGSNGDAAEPIVGFYKGFRPVYGARTLMAAIPLILSKRSSTRFELIGDGPELLECRALACELGVDAAIRWLPRMPHESIRSALERWSLCVIPSVHEAFGVAALESSAMGVSVVASDVGGLRDTVRNGDTGILVPAGDPSSLSEAVIELLENPDRRRRMARAGRAFVEREYDAARVYDRWVRMYRETLERSLVMV